VDQNLANFFVFQLASMLDGHKCHGKILSLYYGTESHPVSIV